METPKKDEQKSNSLKHCRENVPPHLPWEWFKIYQWLKLDLLDQTARPDQKPSSWHQEFSTHWITILTTCAVFAGIVTLRFIVPSPMSFWPLFIIVCIIPAVVINRRWGTIAAIVCTITISLMRIFLDIEPFQALVFLWNFIMRFLFFETYVVIFDYIRRQGSALPPAHR